MAAGILDFDHFVKLHELLLLSAGVPEKLHKRLYDKLRENIFDGGSYFRIEVDSGIGRRRLIASRELKKCEDIFLVDHAWSFRLRDARTQLESNEELTLRMATLMSVTDSDDPISQAEHLEAGVATDSLLSSNSAEEKVAAASAEGKPLTWLELDDAGITDDQLQSLELQLRTPELIGLSLWGNKLQSVESVLDSLKGLSNLKALWMNENPVTAVCDAELQNRVLDLFPKLEIYNKCLTDRYGPWAVSFCADDGAALLADSMDSPPLSGITDLDLSNRSISVLKREVFNPGQLPQLSSLNLRGNKLDGSTPADLVATLRGLPLLEVLVVDIPGPLGASLSEVAGSLPHLKVINGVPMGQALGSVHPMFGELNPRPPSWTSQDSLCTRVLRAMWQYVQVYRLASEDQFDETPVWYVMDELGSAIWHSDTPSLAVVPFLFMPEGRLETAISYTLVWPTADLAEGDEGSRDFLPNVSEEKQRSARLAAWFHTPEQYFEQALADHWTSRQGPADLPSGLPAAAHASVPSASLADGPLKVFTDLPPVEQHLTHPGFTLVEEPSQADVVYTSTQIDDSARSRAGIKAEALVNQFPFESCLVMKHHLAHTVHSAYGKVPWLPITYNLESELAAAIGDYLRGEAGREGKLWIVKPWNMARSLDSWVVDSLEQMIRMVETGPKICQKYIEEPATFHGRKFDLRYLVLVRSLAPLDLCLHHVFWARIANKEYSTAGSSLLDFETHFTVMNYIGKMVHVPTHQFVAQFEEEHHVSWPLIHSQVEQLIGALFKAAVTVHPEMHSAHSRAIYGVDIMIDKFMNPKLLEVTYCPDMTRAITHDFTIVSGPREGEVLKGSEFVNSVFGCLFLNEMNGVAPLT